MAFAPDKLAPVAAALLLGFALGRGSVDGPSAGPQAGTPAAPTPAAAPRPAAAPPAPDRADPGKAGVIAATAGDGAPAKLAETALPPRRTAVRKRVPGPVDRRLLQAAERAQRSGRTARALELALPMAQTGVAPAQLRVGQLLAGKAAPQRNLVLAWAWLKLAQRHGADAADRALDRVTRRLDGAAERSAQALLNV